MKKFFLIIIFFLISPQVWAYETHTLTTGTMYYIDHPTLPYNEPGWITLYTVPVGESIKVTTARAFLSPLVGSNSRIIIWVDGSICEMYGEGSLSCDYYKILDEGEEIMIYYLNSANAGYGRAYIEYQTDFVSDNSEENLGMNKEIFTEEELMEIYELQAIIMIFIILFYFFGRILGKIPKPKKKKIFSGLI